MTVDDVKCLFKFNGYKNFYIAVLINEQQMWDKAKQ